MGIEHCLTMRMDDEFAKFTRAADKTLTQRLFNMSVARLPPVRTSERTTRQRYEINGKVKTENGKVFGMRGRKSERLQIIVQ